MGAARALSLVWATRPSLAIAIAALTLIGGLLPTAIAWVGKWVVDGVVEAAEATRTGAAVDRDALLWPLGLELVLVLSLAATQRGLGTCQALLRALLGQRVNEMILEKALTLDLRHFEDSEFYDRLTKARREASSRPLGMVMRTFGGIQNLVALAGFAVIMATFAPWSVALLVLAGLPAFFAEVKFSGAAFRLFSWRAPETRMQNYLETVIAREDHAKEVKIYDLGALLLDRYRRIFDGLYREDRALTLRRSFWGFLTSALGTAALYFVYAMAVWSAAVGVISLGAMTMVMLAFRQGQAAVAALLGAIGGMVEDDLYLSNLFEFLEAPTEPEQGTLTQGPDPGRGICFEDVSFAYPGADEPALSEVSFELPRGSSLALVGRNGSGKTTLIKLMTRLYAPTRGRITFEGADLRAWNPKALRSRIAVVFQDFVRYQLLAGENIGAGDVTRFDAEPEWRRAAQVGGADEFLATLPHGYRTQLGKWFKDGRELSGGQWQKVALSRAFMREDASVLVLDEPTAALDAEAEAEVFEHVRAQAAGRSTVLISHRFSSVRNADAILVLERGRIAERGDHASLMAADGRYAHLFRLQAAGYAE